MKVNFSLKGFIVVVAVLVVGLTCGCSDSKKSGAEPQGGGGPGGAPVGGPEISTPTIEQPTGVVSEGGTGGGGGEGEGGGGGGGGKCVSDAECGAGFICKDGECSVLTVPVPPEVSSTDPSKGAINVLNTATIKVVFSKKMNFSTITFLVGEGVNSYDEPISGDLKSISDSSVEFTPSTPLKTSTQYTVTVTKGAKDSEGAALKDDYSFGFVTSATPADPLKVVSTVPENNATYFVISYSIVINYNRHTVSHAYTFVNKDTSTPVQFDWGCDVVVGCRTVTIKPSYNLNLDLNTNYEVTISKDVSDVYGHKLGDSYGGNDYVLKFNTGGMAPLTVNSVSPQPAATSVDVDTKVVVKFSNVMNCDTLEASGVFTVTADGSGSPVGGSIACDDASATFTPSKNLGSLVKYTAKVTTAAKDVVGNALIPTDCIWNFTTSTMPAIASGQYHVVALKNNGTVWAWGYNGYGQLGDQTTSNKLGAVQVKDPANTSGPNIGFLENVVAIAAGNNHTVALKKDGTVWTWGYNNYGQLGNGTTTSSNVPVQVKDPANTSGPNNGFLENVVAIAAGNSHTVALKNNGTVWAWGFNYYGQLGNGTTTLSSTPVQVTGISDASAIAAGAYHSMEIVTGGAIKAWGYNGTYQLGEGVESPTNKSTPVQVNNINGAIGICGSEFHSMAVKGDGKVWAWGLNDNYQLGDGTTDYKSAPVLSNIDGATAIACGFKHSLAVTGGKKASDWGYNYFGQLGNGTVANSSTPVIVKIRINTTEVDLIDVIAIAGGYRHSVALTVDGAVYTWGTNDVGQLGNNSNLGNPYAGKVFKPNGGDFNLKQ